MGGMELELADKDEEIMKLKDDIENFEEMIKKEKIEMLKLLNQKMNDDLKNLKIQSVRRCRRLLAEYLFLGLVSPSKALPKSSKDFIALSFFPLFYVAAALFEAVPCVSTTGSSSLHPLKNRVFS
ncbi:hypothetical protein M9H77_29912 [Catharanthus roseus]|uniref:Uncharacterized protein n=1 Tax=Catharanthus roseus TaxID=4058 RepID=A0ACB9ZWT3_CATRO|nr:hypothetical protein M9H77_29912 [Catharanthus roseus]